MPLVVQADSHEMPVKLRCMAILGQDEHVSVT